MGEDNKGNRKVVVLVTVVSGIFAVLANATEIYEFVESKLSPPKQSIKTVQENMYEPEAESNERKQKFQIDDQGKVTFIQGTKIILVVKSLETFVGTGEKGWLQGSFKEIDENVIYTIHNTPDNYTALQGQIGFVRVADDESNCPTYENADEIQAWECYEFFQHDNYIAIKSQANGRYLTCVQDEAGERIYGRGEEIKEWELFAVYVSTGKEWVNIFTNEVLDK